jgi:hypothetical protein
MLAQNPAIYPGFTPTEADLTPVGVPEGVGDHSDRGTVIDASWVLNAHGQGAGAQRQGVYDRRMGGRVLIIQGALIARPFEAAVAGGGDDESQTVTGLKAPPQMVGGLDHQLDERPRRDRAQRATSKSALLLAILRGGGRQQ